MIKSFEVLDTFNQKYSLNVPIVIQTNFYGDLTPDDEEWIFYNINPNQYLINRGLMYIEEIGCFRSGPYFTHLKKEGFTLFKGNRNKEIFPTSANSFTFRMYIDYKATKFSYHVDYIHKENLFNRWWTDDLNNIKLQYPEIAERIKTLLSDSIKDLQKIAETKGHKKGWIYYQFNNKKFKGIINDEFLKDTCFYYDPIIFFNQFSF